jgi:hypothetical protein
VGRPPSSCSGCWIWPRAEGARTLPISRRAEPQAPEAPEEVRDARPDQGEARALMRP